MEYSQLKGAITSVIKENGNEEITGQLMQDALIAIINALGLGFQFMGKATPATDPGTPDARVFYIAFESGLYSNFGGVTLDGKSLVLFLYSTNWSTITIDVPTSAVLTDYLKIADLAATTGQGTNTSMTQKAITDALDGKVDKVAGKGLSTNDFTNALKTLVENSIQQSKIVQELGDDATAIISQAAMTIILAGYAKIDGYYQSLTAGAAENLVGRGSVPASFLRRTTGGTADIGTGSAKITKLMGNSIVWNQIVQNGNFSEGAQGWVAESSTMSVSGGELSFTATARYGRIRTGALSGLVNGHKYALFADINSNNVCHIQIRNNTQSTAYLDQETINGRNGHIFTVSEMDSADVVYLRVLNYAESDWQPVSVKNVTLFDLTLMFGAGNEPVTVDAFNALFPLPYYAYNPGVVLPFAAQKLVTTGFNQWDGTITETGKYINVAGAPVTGPDYDISDFIPILPNREYYLKNVVGPAASSPAIVWYDKNKQLISGLSGAGNLYNKVVTSPAGAAYLKCSLYRPTIDDICINLSWSGIRNGEYEPYEKHEAIIDPYNWSDTDGNDVYPFGGMHGVGAVRDYATPDADGFIRKATRMYRRVDLGSLAWNYNGTYFTVLNLSPAAGTSGICAKYNVVPLSALYVSMDKTIGINGNIIYIKDTAYTDAATFKAAMSGIYLYYELANPVEIELATPVAVSYYANDWGTEAWEPENTDVPYTAPCDMLIAYAMNAVDTLRRLPENYISTGSFENFCTELATKLGAALNKTITITPTYNDTTQEYTFAISIVDAG